MGAKGSKGRACLYTSRVLEEFRKCSCTPHRRDAEEVQRDGGEDSESAQLALAFAGHSRYEY